MLAARLFSIETYVGLAAALAGLSLPGRARFKLGYAAAALLAINEWLLKPVMAQAHLHGSAAGLGFGAWHGHLARCMHGRVGHDLEERSMNEALALRA